jgi:uncharacterized cupin superfamily protein
MSTLPVASIHDVPQTSAIHSGQRFACTMHDLGRRLGAHHLGANVTVIAPGKAAFPFHHHRVNEELCLVIAGEGDVRFGDQTHRVREGDLFIFPPGGPEVAHQVSNPSADTPLRLLCLSTLFSPEVVGYPDSGKFGVRLDVRAPDGERTTVFRHLGRPAQMLDYWDGVPTE